MELAPAVCANHCGSLLLRQVGFAFSLALAGIISSTHPSTCSGKMPPTSAFTCTDLRPQILGLVQDNELGPLG